MRAIRFRLRIFLLMFVAVMVLGTLGFTLTEKMHFTDALYFSIVTIATVGYGDISPATEAGKLLAIFLIILGVGTFLGVVANATEMMLNRREQERHLEKLHLIIGVFFSEVGAELLVLFAQADTEIDQIRAEFIGTDAWDESHFRQMQSCAEEHKCRVEATDEVLAEIRRLLLDQRGCLIALLENPTLLEHESFTDLLRAVFHLAEELSYREGLSEMPKNDRSHLAVDMRRVYRLLLAQWLDYMQYLKGSYPYLFSLALRTNPLDANRSAVIAD